MTRVVPVLLVLSLSACVDYGYQKEVIEPEGYHPDTAVQEVRVDTSTALDCILAAPLPDGSAVDESCVATVETGPLDAVVEWDIRHWDNYNDYGDALTVPVVGQLTDDDGDGAVTALDIPDIVITTDDNGRSPLTRGVLRIVAGDGSSQQTIHDGTFGEAQVFPYRYATAALGDVDGDLLPDIVGVVQTVRGSSGSDSAPPADADTASFPYDPPVFTDEEACYVGVWAPDGSLLWVSDTVLDCAGHAIALADLEGDGAAEILVGAHVFDGATGVERWEGTEGEARYRAYSQVGSQSFALDLDGDGLQEVIAGSAIYGFDGRLRCTIDPGLPDGFPAAADFDADGRGDIVLVGNGQAHVHDDACRLRAAWSLPGGGNGGPPTIADFDGDGVPEIGIAAATAYSVYEADGTLLWSAPTSDSSSFATGSSVFDFDGDGRAEVVYGDETTLWVYDGKTGAVRFQDDRHTSRTLHEYPLVADVDADGQPEILVTQGGGHYDASEHGIYALGSASGAWLGDRQVWNQHAFSITNINDDLTLPAPALANWPEHNTFRSGDLALASAGRTPDAIPYAEACTDPCMGGRIDLLVRVGNGGMSGMRGNVPVSLYAEVGGERVWLASQRTGGPIGSGANGGTLHFRVDPADVPEGVAWVVVDDDDGVQQVSECHEDNNAIRVEGLSCAPR